MHLDLHLRDGELQYFECSIVVLTHERVLALDAWMERYM